MTVIRWSEIVAVGLPPKIVFPGIQIWLHLSEFNYLLGFMNASVLFDGNPEDSIGYRIYAPSTSDETLQLMLENAQITLIIEFTTIRYAGAWFHDAIYKAREMIEAGLAKGPRIQPLGSYSTIPGGGGDLSFPEIPPNKVPLESQKGLAKTPGEFSARAEVNPVMKPMDAIKSAKR